MHRTRHVGISGFSQTLQFSVIVIGLMCRLSSSVCKVVHCNKITEAIASRGFDSNVAQYASAFCMIKFTMKFEGNSFIGEGAQNRNKSTYNQHIYCPLKNQGND